jgi:hypothetical protein
VQNFSEWKLARASELRAVETLFASKKLAEPGLEVADFLMHTAGTQVWRGTWPAKRRDFIAMFGPSETIPDRLVKFFENLDVKVEKK